MQINAVICNSVPFDALWKDDLKVFLMHLQKSRLESFSELREYFGMVVFVDQQRLSTWLGQNRETRIRRHFRAAGATVTSKCGGQELRLSDEGWSSSSFGTLVVSSLAAPKAQKTNPSNDPDCVTYSHHC